MEVLADCLVTNKSLRAFLFVIWNSPTPFLTTAEAVLHCILPIAIPAILHLS